MSAASSAFGVYLHVPFCSVRCGYCDFNTYTATELGGGASQMSYARTAVTEIALAEAELQRRGLAGREVSTVFFGGGTPTLLPTADLAAMLGAVASTWGLARDAEITTEANPDSVGRSDLADLRAAGFTRVSFGMQSAVPHVLATLDRTHDPERVPQVVAWAREAGLAVSLDLIYGTPGESVEDWRRSVQAVLALEPDHVSAYALTIEPGTKMHARVRRGDLPGVDGDDQATKYEVADTLLEQAGYGWYEISNWARSPEQRCRHNIAYWSSEDWWGVGPGAHSHLAGQRFWNVKHPRAYAQRVEAGELPIAETESLTSEQIADERVLLGIRLVEGLPVDPAVRHLLPAMVEEDLLDAVPAASGVARLTRRGRLLADTVVGRLVS
ncbi:radical SAM family heme chaperone HemW [Pseudactinotalea suaedae]|uniref:radical SAM family heme chaperone HemW n=1 Tax=Pseudactinotalea suaedae TaxID=1524924 RepID=UPI0012E2D7B0|nr:radical SAM family heme chaperone HemW [Pseudactinotalea suaedae]